MIFKELPCTPTPSPSAFASPHKRAGSRYSGRGRQLFIREQPSEVFYALNQEREPAPIILLYPALE
jgi:hypothetical protein